MHWYWNGWNGWWWHMGFMWLFWIVVIVAVVWALARGISGRTQMGERQDSPEQILKRRYASGEIDKEEYERRLSDLRR